MVGVILLWKVGCGILGVMVQEGTWASGQRGWVELDSGG